jgi:hypothetical protein
MNQRALSALASGMDLLNDLDSALGSDTLRCIQQCTASGKQLDSTVDIESNEEYQFWARALVRSFFAHVEGLSYAMRQLALSAHEAGSCTLDAEEVVLLREVDYRVDVRRKSIKPQTRSNRTLENFYLTFRCFPKAFGTAFEPAYSENGWNLFQRSLELRHDLTHPKARQNLTLSRAAAVDVTSAIQWFGVQIQGLLKTCQSGLRGHEKGGGCA